MEYEVADKFVSSDNEMVRDVVDEEVTDTLSPSGEENIVIGGNHTDQPDAIDLIGPLPALLTACNVTVYSVDGFSPETVASLALPSLTFTVLISVPLALASYYVASYHSITLQTRYLSPLDCDTDGCDSAFSRHRRVSRS